MNYKIDLSEQNQDLLINADVKVEDYNIYIDIVKEQSKRKFMTQSHRSKSIYAYDS